MTYKPSIPSFCTVIQQFEHRLLKSLCSRSPLDHENTLNILHNYYLYKHKVNANEYIDHNFFELYRANPDSIKYVSPLRGKKANYGIVHDFSVAKCQEVSDDPIYSCFINYSETGDLKDNELYQDFETGIQKGRWGRYQSVNDYQKRLDDLKNLYDQINECGYLSQKELHEEKNKDLFKNNNDCVHPYLNEVSVDVGPHGGLFWRHSGRHRLIIAKILGLSTIPVIVISRHKNWNGSLTTY